MNRLFYIFLLLLTFPYNLKAQTFKISVDTLHLNFQKIVRPASRVNLTHAVKFNGKYYCFFKEEGLYSFKIETKYFIIISSNGDIINNIEVPQSIKNIGHFDFFIRNDSLLVKTYQNNGSFFFDLNKLAWNKIKEVDDRVYENANFIVTYRDFGEWGQSTWFIDKRTKEEYVLGGCGTIINLLNGKYYLTNETEINEIENPRNLQLCDRDHFYQLVEKETEQEEGSNSLVGMKAIYKDTTFSPWNFKQPKQSIVASFVLNNQLYQLYSESNSTYLGIIENEKLIPIQNIGKRYSIFNLYYSFRGNNLNNNTRFLKFREDNNTFGFIEIKNNKIDIHYLKDNIDSLKYLKSDGFEKLINLVKINSENLSLAKAKSNEEDLGGFDMKTDRVGISHNGYYPIVYKCINVRTNEFIKVEDKNISQITEYLYTTKDKKVKSIFIEWTKTEPYTESNSLKTFKDEKTLAIERFKRKQNEIVEIITRQLGFEPQKKNCGDGYIELSWILKNGCEIVLFGNETFDVQQVIRMIINLK